MLKRTELHEAALDWITRLPTGRQFTNSDIYRFLENSFPKECGARGDAANEPRYKNDARYAVQDALGKKKGASKLIDRIAYATYAVSDTRDGSSPRGPFVALVPRGTLYLFACDVAPDCSVLGRGNRCRRGKPKRSSSGRTR